MKNLIFIDILAIFTNDKLHEGCGGSEFQVHVLAKKLAKNNNVYFFTKYNKEEIINNVNYLPLSKLNDTQYHIKDATIIIQRMIHLIANPIKNKRMPPGLENFNLRNIFKTNKIIVWCHDFITKGLILGDYIEKDPNYFSDNSLINALDLLNKDNNLDIVCVSEFQKNKFMDLCKSIDYNFESNKLKVIYNALYSEYFKKENYNYNNNNLCYISSWGKGLDKVLNLFSELIKQDSSFILYLLTPGYEGLSKNKKYIEELHNKYGKNIKILNKTNKHELSKIIGESLCLIGPKREETFGCVYQEAYYLNTPVILDKRCGGSLEIVSDESIIDFDNKEEFIERVLKLKEKRELVELDTKFFYYNILKIWRGNI